MKLFEKRIEQFQVKKHWGFCTVERFMIYTFIGIPYKKQWETEMQSKWIKHYGPIEQPIKFANYEAASIYVKRLVTEKQRLAAIRLKQYEGQS